MQAEVKFGDSDLTGEMTNLEQYTARVRFRGQKQQSTNKNKSRNVEHM